MSMESARPLPKRHVTRDELLDFYQSIRSAETIGIFDAAEALTNDDVATAYQRLSDAKTRYEMKHKRTLKQLKSSTDILAANPRQQKRHNQIISAITTFDLLLSALEKNVKIKRAQPKERNVFALRDREAAAVELTPELIALFDTDEAKAWEQIESQFTLDPVDTTNVLSPHSVLLVRSRGRWHLLRTPAEVETETLSVLNLSTQRRVSVSKSKLVEAGTRKQTLRLRRREVREESKAKSDDEIVLDESELTVLWSIVRDTNLLPNASEITQIKKNEFRKRQYDRALKKMQILQRSFGVVVRNQKHAFSRELAHLEGQKQKMSLREIERRKLEISRALRLIERAENHFTKVMNSLLALEARRSS